MAVFRYIHGDGKTLKFDGSPKSSICKYWGYSEGKFSLGDGKPVPNYNRTRYDVFAGLPDYEGQKAKKPYKVGVLEYQPPAWPGGASIPWD